MRQSYATDVIREKIAGPPFLIEGETLDYEVRHGISPAMAIVAVVLTFIPPFIWGPGLYLLMHFQKKSGGAWVTNKRLVDFQKLPFSKQYAVTSIPLGEITKIRRAPIRVSIFDLITKPIERLFGIDDIQIFVRDSNWVQCSITDVKSPGQLIEHVRKVTNAEG
jgi:hypothetical protein